MSIKIGSFNMNKFSYQSDDKTRKDPELIAKIISGENLDIIALQEVFTSGAVDLVINALNKRGFGSHWAYRWEEPKKTSSSQAREGYAFIWNTNTIELSYSEKVDSTWKTVKTFAEPHIYNQYRVDKREGQTELLRNPYYGRFKPKGLFCEIRLLNVHIRYDKSNEYSLSNNEMRKHEFKILTKCLYHQISMKRYGNNLPSYTILLGDYNLNLDRPWTKSPYVGEVITVDDNGTKQSIRTYLDQLTTLKKNEDNQEEDKKLRGFANNYDHFSYDEKRFEGVYTRSKKVDAVRKYMNDDFQNYKYKVSDHVPISLSINLRNEQKED